ncbi:helix-turn-helix transcriptional regulator [Bradyrhizobium sp. 157]|uniref:helix-turn-helix transcriptional regulator n=2 Tax=Bradyrhizobium TaxID=374 RepID=UPI001FFB4609|nr:helix-turn-helix transcriptional regulator [Bradyrhizobium sp. 157]
MSPNGNFSYCKRTVTSAICRRTLTFGSPMLIRTPADLGAVIRDRRKRLKLDQSTLAKRIGVSRQWVIDIEHGHPRAELALVLRALDALGILLDASSESSTSTSRVSAPSAVDINAIVAKAKKGKA